MFCSFFISGYSFKGTDYQYQFPGYEAPFWKRSPFGNFGGYLYSVVLEDNEPGAPTPNLEPNPYYNREFADYLKV
jgi:hypothetical protein